MTALDRVREFLLSNPSYSYCDDCLSSVLNIKPRTQVQQKTSALAKTHLFRRNLGRCVRCQSDKLIIGSREPNKPSTTILPERKPDPPTVLPPATSLASRERNTDSNGSVFSEDEVKRVLESWLIAQGWSLEIAWAKSRGIDIHAQRGSERWIIEVKGGGSLPAMRVNYFLGVIGETLQRMDDSAAEYSIALPDLKQFRNLWARLPILAKERTQISALFVTRDGSVEKVTK